MVASGAEAVARGAAGGSIGGERVHYARRMSFKTLLAFVLTPLVLAVDIWTKGVAVNLLPREGVMLAGDRIQVKVLLNDAMMLGLGEPTVIVTLLSFMGASACFYAYAGRISQRMGVALLLIGGGGLANGYDRALDGAVVDFIMVNGLPVVFNVADVFIVAGVLVAWWEAARLLRSTGPSWVDHYRLPRRRKHDR
jgi:lipoprotein signal peptidase